MDLEKNPWQVKDQRQVYNNKWIQVIEYDVINPSGGKGIYGKVHFKNLAIGIIALDEELHTYLVGQYRFTLNQYSWEIPEGGGPMGEPPLESAKRELLEETGLKAREWTELYRVHLSNSVSDEDGYLYLARGLEQFDPMPEDTEQLQVKRVSLDEALQMMEEGTITDSLTMIALQKVAMMRAAGKL